MSENVLTITQSNFKENVEDFSQPVLVDFWAPWCGPCRQIAPELEAAASELGAKARIGKVNVDEEAELAQSFSVQSIPTLIVFKNGKQVERLVGFQDRKSIVKILSS